MLCTNDLVARKRHPFGWLFCFRGGPTRMRSRPPDRLSRRLHNQAKRVEEITLQRASADCSSAVRHQPNVVRSTKGERLCAEKECNRSVLGSHFPLEDRQARLSGAECGNIDACRQNPSWYCVFYWICCTLNAVEAFEHSQLVGGKLMLRHKTYKFTILLEISLTL